MIFEHIKEKGASRVLDTGNATLSTQEKEAITAYLEKNREKGVEIVGVSECADVAQKLYTPTDAHISLVASGLAKSVAWVKENLLFLKLAASDTRIDSDRDKFTEYVLQLLGDGYSKGWGENKAGGTNVCIMHNRYEMVGKTYSYEIVDMVENDVVALDENGRVVRKLIVYAYIDKQAQWHGSLVTRHIDIGTLSKVSISAWISGFEYIGSDRSNYIPEGYTMPVSYYLYGTNARVETMEISLVDIGANGSGQIEKKKMYEVRVIDNTPTSTNENTPENKPTEKALETEKEMKPPANTDANDTQIALMKSVFDTLPTHLHGATWVKVVAKNLADTAPFDVPAEIAQKFEILDKKLTNVSLEVEALKLDKSNLERSSSLLTDKNELLGIEKVELTKQLEKSTTDLATANKSLTTLQSEMVIEKDIYVQKYVAIKSQLKRLNSLDLDLVRTEAAQKSMSELRTDIEGLLIELSEKSKQDAVQAEKEAALIKRKNDKPLF
jgi:hypothetical protein